VNERILVAIDGSRPSRAGLDWSVERVRNSGGQLTLVNVVDDTLAGFSRDVESRVARRVMNSLDTERARIEREFPKLHVTTQLAYGSVWRTLRDLSAHFDLLVIGTHKNGILKGTFLGSLGIRIAATAACSVAIIPQDAPSGRSVVVGVDETAESWTACEFAALQAHDADSELIIVCAGYVANPLFEDLVPPVLPAKERARIVARASERVLERFPTLSVQTRVMDGPPDQALLDTARDAGLLVVGHHKRSKIAQFFERSVAQDVLIGMSTPVIVVHHSMGANLEPADSEPEIGAQRHE
jgi:nucleotide-binding universal stress UspA family protein